MPSRRWTARYRDHDITLHNHWSFMPGSAKGEWLVVDGKTVATDKSWMGARLSATLDLSGEQVELTGLIGQDGLIMRGQIYLNGTMIGGDASLGFMDRNVVEKTVKKGFLATILGLGLPVYGVTFGLGMAFVTYLEHGADLTKLLKTFIIAGGLYGFLMGAFFYVISLKAMQKLYPSLRNDAEPGGPRPNA